MEDMFLMKMLKKSLLQYGRNLDVDPLMPEERERILEKIKTEKDEESEWYEVIEDIVYSYVTSQL